MSPPDAPPAYPTDAYEDFWAVVDAEPRGEPPVAVADMAGEPATDAYAEFLALADG